MHTVVGEEAGARETGVLSMQEYAARCKLTTLEFIAAVGQNLGIPDHRIARCQRVYDKSEGDPGLTPDFLTKWMREHTVQQSCLKLHKRNPLPSIISYASSPPLVATT